MIDSKNPPGINRSTKQERPKSSNFAHHNNKCRHQICTCHLPSHKCPIDFNREGHLPPSHYQQEYVKHEIGYVQQLRPIDNLKNGKEFFDGTQYQREYKPYKNQAELHDQNERNKLINQAFKANNYNHDHLGYITSLPQNPHKVQATYTERNLEDHYEKPGKFMHQKVEKLPKGEFQKESEYGHKYKPTGRDYSGDIKVNYDNLHVYHGPLNGNNTTYRAEHVPKEPTKKINDHLFDLNKRNNNLTYGQFLPKDNFGNGTEYHRNYYEKKAVYGHCDIHDLPSLTQSQKRMPKHLYYNDHDEKWIPERV